MFVRQMCKSNCAAHLPDILFRLAGKSFDWYIGNLINQSIVSEGGIAMKLFILTLCALILFSACSPTQPDEASQAAASSSTVEQPAPELEVPNKTLHLSEAGQEILSHLNNPNPITVEILAFTDRWVIYLFETSINREDDTANYDVCYYDIQTQQSTLITTIAHHSTSSMVIAHREGKIYYPFTVKENQYPRYYILEIDVATLQTQVIACTQAYSPIGVLLATEDGLLRSYHQAESEEITHYLVDFIDLEGDHQNKTIIKTTYIYSPDRNISQGEIMMGLHKEGDRIYCYIIQVENETTERYFIRAYTLDGVMQQEYPLPDDSFGAFLDLSLEFTEGERDGVFQLVKANDYFIFNTINSRNHIVKRSNGILESISIPKSLRTLDSRGNIINEQHSDDSLIYFYSLESLVTEQDDGKIYLFDPKNQAFSSIVLKAPKGAIRDVRIDQYGNFLVFVEINNDPYQGAYYFLSAEDIQRSLK